MLQKSIMLVNRRRSPGVRGNCACLSFLAMRNLVRQFALNVNSKVVWQLLFISFMVTVVLLSHTGKANAYGLTQCAPDRFGSDIGCTANDVSITGIVLAPGGPTSCVGGSSVNVDLDVTVNFSTPDRWDIGIFLSTDGKDPQTLSSGGGSAVCSVSVLPTTAPFLDLDPGPYNGVFDTCGDGNGAINGGTGSGVLRISNVPVSCQAINLSGGNLYIPFVVSWDNQSSDHGGGICTSNANPVPNTKSKCNSPKTTIAAEVLYGTVNTVVLPTITKTDGITTIAPGDSTTYTVVITNTTGVTLSNALFTDPAVTNLTVNSLSCAAANGATCPASPTVAAMQGAGITIPAMPVNGSVTFTIGATLSGTATGTLTNTATVTVAGQSNLASDIDTIVPKVTIRKQSNGGTGSFSFSGGTNGLPASLTLDTGAGNPSSSASYKLTANGVATAITETIPAGWALNATSTSCTDGSSTFGTLSGGTLTIPAAEVTSGRNITCTFVNDKYATITVNKTLLPSSDTGKFNLLVGATTVATNVGDTGTGNTTVPANVAVTVSETAGTSTSLTNYATTYSCTGGYTVTNVAGTSINIPAGSVTPGSATTCTFTNNKLATVIIRKQSNNGTGTFGYTMTNLASASDSIITVVAGTPVNGATNNVTLTTSNVTVTEGTVPAGWPANPVSASCSDANSAVTGNPGSFGSLATNVLTIPSANLLPGAQISCLFVNTAIATITVNKTLTPSASPDRFNLLVGATTVATAVGNGGNGIATVPAGTTVTVSETAAGSTSLTDYDSTYSCSGGITGSGTSVNITPAVGASVFCTFTNSLKMPLLAILKSADASTANPGQVVVYTVQISNSGAGAGTSVVLSDAMSPYGSFGVDTYGSSPSKPFSFTDSSPASGLSLGTPEYSYDNSSSWTTTTPPGGVNAPAGYNGNVTNWRIPMTGTILSGGSFTLNYQIKVK